MTIQPPVQHPRPLGTVLADLVAWGRFIAPGGILTAEDRQGLARRAALVCGVSIETALEAMEASHA